MRPWTGVGQPATRIVLLVALLLVGGAASGARAAGVGTAADMGTAAEGMRWLAGGFADLAPAGVPDFSQCRSGWGQPGTPPQWTYAAPVALADALWWLDSRAEREATPPPAVSDSHPLVTAYPVFGPARDDHSPETLRRLVEDVALRVDTDGRRSASERRGTRWTDAVAGLRGYLADRRLDTTYEIVTHVAPDGATLATLAAREAGVVLLLGVWQGSGDGRRRVGGHYVALAGVGLAADAVALADPLADRAALGGAGRALPPDPSVHSCRQAAAAHDDPARVSHDRYALRPAADGPAVLVDYFEAGTQHEAAAFAGQNPGPLGPSGTWALGPVEMAIDAALAIVPPDAPAPTASPRPTSTAEATSTAAPTGTPAPPTATATSGRGTPTATATVWRRVRPIAPRPVLLPSVLRGR